MKSGTRTINRLESACGEYSKFNGASGHSCMLEYNRRDIAPPIPRLAWGCMTLALRDDLSRCRRSKQRRTTPIKVARWLAPPRMGVPPSKFYIPHFRLIKSKELLDVAGELGVRCLDMKSSETGGGTAWHFVLRVADRPQGPAKRRYEDSRLPQKRHAVIHAIWRSGLGTLG